MSQENEPKEKPWLIKPTQLFHDWNNFCQGMVGGSTLDAQVVHMLKRAMGAFVVRPEMKKYEVETDEEN